MGLCRLPTPAPGGGERLHRRLDIKSYPREYFAYATLYFTGSAYFNRSMRAYINLCGWTCSDHGLRRATRDRTRSRTSEGYAVECITEADIFAACGLPYRAPTQREIEIVEEAVVDEAGVLGAPQAPAGSAAAPKKWRGTGQ